MTDGYISQIKTLDNKTYLLRDSEKTDENVNQTSNSENKEFPIILKNTNNTTDETAGVKYAGGVTVNPSEKTVTADEFIGNLNMGRLVPISTKTYNAPLYQSSGANFYQNFATVTPTDYNAIWIAHYRITVTAAGHSDYTEICDVSISGRANTYYSYKIYNSIVTYSIYQHMLLNSNSASVPHELGYRMQGSYGADNVAKVIKVELLEQLNCTVTLLDNLKLYTSATPSGYTWRGFTATSNGLQEAGDNDAYGYYILSNGFKGKAGSNKVYRYCLFARTGDGTYESFVMESNTRATTKTANPHGFVPDGKIYWNSSGSDYSEGTLNISPYEQYHTLDYLYSFNFDNQFLPDYCETYVVYTYNENDGLLYLDTTQWLAVALPTTEDGKIYQRIGSKYYTGTSNYYQGSLLLDNPYYEYRDGEIRSWSATHLSSITGADDLKVIEAINETTGLLKKTAANTWTLDTSDYVTSSGITSVTIGATSPVQSSTSTAQTGSSASTTISLKDAYGDTKNPYGSKTKNYVLAAPSNANGTPSFRALVAADIPSLAYVPATGGVNDVNTLVNTGVYNITSGSATNAPKGYGFGQLLVMSYRKHTGNTTTDWASQIYLHNGVGTETGNATGPGNVLYYRTSNTSSSNSWFSWQKAVHVDDAYIKVGDTNKPVYIAADGTATPISYTIAKSVPSDAVFTDHYAWTDITSKPATATRWPTWNEVTEKPDTFTPDAHEHNYIGKDGFIAYPSDGRFSTRNSYTGYIKIKIPYTKSATMFTFDVDIYNYSGDTSVRYHIGGYNYDNASWINTTAYCIAPLSNTKGNLTVRFWSNSDDEMYVSIGEPDTSWSIPSIIVHNITLNFNNDTLAKWKSGWIITIENTAFDTNLIKVTKTNTNIAYKTNAANLTSTTNAVAYYTDTTGTFGSKASANGALYATSANGALQWGTLPIAQGGTGATTAANARTNLGLGTMALETATNYLARSGGQMTGPLTWKDGTALPQASSLSYVLGIDAFASGGTTKWIGIDGLRTSLGLSNALHFIGQATTTLADGDTGTPTISGKTYSTKTAGDVVLGKDDGREYVWTGSAWEILGQDASTTYDSGATATNTWVSRIQQASDRTITVTTAALDTSGTWSGNAATATGISKTGGSTANFWRGDNTWSSTLAGSITISKAGECGLEVINSQTTNPHKGFFGGGSSGNFGIYDRTYNKWIVYSDPNGNAVLNGNANTATTATNLSAKPSLAANGNNITVTAGGKTSEAFTVPYATSAGTATSLTNFVVSTYTIAASKGVRIKYPAYAPVLISCQRSTGGSRLILIGGGYGEEGTVRNDFTELVSPSESHFTWSMPQTTGYGCTIEIMHHDTSGTATVWVESTAACTFTEIDSLTSTKTNRNLLHSANTSAGANNNTTLAWNTAYTIAKINGTDIKFTTMSAPTTISGNAGTATTLQNARTLWGQSFDGSANITGNLIDVGNQIKLLSGQTELQFLTSTGGAANGKFGKLGLNTTYANVDFTNYILDVNGKARIGALDGGQHVINGNVQLNAQSGSYNEGLRINRSTTGYANIYLGGTRSSASGNQTGGWWIGTLSTPADATSNGDAITNTVFTISNNNTADTLSIKGTRGATIGTNSGWAIRPRLAIGTTYNTSYTLYVAGTGYFTNNVNIVTTSTTANTAAYGTLTLGNNANVNTTTAHSEGQIVIYSAATQAHTIKGTSTTTAYTHTLPNDTGLLVSLSGGTAKGSTTKPVYIPNTGIVTECSTYAGGTKVTFNGADKGASTASFYAPTAGGTAGHVLIGAGTTTAPAWYGGTVMSGTAAASWKTAFNGTTDATASNAAAVTIAGGLGIAKSIIVGEIATVADDILSPRFTLTVNGTDKAYLQYNATDDSIDFIFV